MKLNDTELNYIYFEMDSYDTSNKSDEDLKKPILLTV